MNRAWPLAMALRVMWVALLLSCGACSAGGDAADPSGESGDLRDHQAGFEVLCHAEIRSGAIAQFPFATKMSTLNGWLDGELKDEYVKTLYAEKLPQEHLTSQGDVLRAQASAAGVTPCPMAGLIDYLSKLSSVAGDVDGCAKACVERHRESDGGADVADDCERGCGG